MKKEIEKTAQVKEVVSLVCDICKKEYSDCFEMQEFHIIDFVAGYASIFGDMNTVKCDVCQHCLKKLLGDHLRIDSALFPSV